MTTRSHEEYKDNIGAYLLGALPELEVELLERHLAGCETCRAEIEQLQPVTVALARSVPQVEPPPSLKASLMATVNAEAAMRAGTPVTAPRRERRSLAQWLSGLQPRMAAGMAVAVLALGVVVGVTAERLGGGTQSTRTLAAKIDRKLLPTGTASLEVKGSNAKLDLTNTPQPPAGRVYQLWYQHGKMIERGGTFRPRPDCSYRADVPVSGTNAVMVTIERAGGAPAPTGPPIMVFNT
jgi:anti-sigma-K factor RskA